MDQHDLKFISLRAKRITVLHRGKVLMEDTMDRVAQNRAVRKISLGSQRQPLQ